MRNYRFVPQLILNVGTILIIAFLLFSYNAWAAPAVQGSTPGVISYQGTLTDNASRPVSGNINMTFRLYNVPSGGTALWTEAHTGPNAVPVQNGLFHVLLGSLSPIPLTVWSNDTLHLSIQIGSEIEMQPREMVGRIPYAHYAFVANKVEGDLFTIKSDEVRTGLPFVLNSERPWEFTGQGTQTGIRSTVDYKDFVFWNQDGSIILSIQARNGAGRLDMHGHPIYNPGAIIEANLQTPAELEAEFISRFSQGDLLCWDSEADRLEKCAKQASSLIVAVADQTGKPIVLGAEPVKVLGPIEPGDLLVASDTPGYAIAWSQVEDGSPLVGVVIAKALEPFEGERGLVKAMILGR